MVLVFNLKAFICFININMFNLDAFSCFNVDLALAVKHILTLLISFYLILIHECGPWLKNSRTVLNGHNCELLQYWGCLCVWNEMSSISNNWDSQT